MRDRIFFPLVSGTGRRHRPRTHARADVHHSSTSGTIECESVPGRTVFTILLPLPSTAHGCSREIAVNVPTSGRADERDRVVWIVDDDRSIRWVLEKALAREGIAFKTFSSAHEALQALAGERAAGAGLRHPHAGRVGPRAAATR